MGLEHSQYVCTAALQLHAEVEEAPEVKRLRCCGSVETRQSPADLASFGSSGFGCSPGDCGLYTTYLGRQVWRLMIPWIPPDRLCSPAGLVIDGVPCLSLSLHGIRGCMRR